MPDNPQKDILAAMMDPGFYPHRVDTIICRETHISTVFLTGVYVYKVKKPVNFGFLDFSTFEKRAHCCRQEVSLNGRLSSGVYLEALPITRRGGCFRLNGAGDPVETVVKMRQLNDADGMLPLLHQSCLTDEDVEKLADRLVAFYASGSAPDVYREFGTPAWEENLQLMEPFVGGVIDGGQFRFVRTASTAYFRRCRRLFQRRVENGRIRDGHGDLRCDHIYFTSRGIQIIDCIEFNESLRILDPISDMAFLSMDLEHSGFLKVARRLINAYVSRTGDLEALPLLYFYQCYRAMVRCKVSCLQLRAIGLSGSRRRAMQTAASAYLALAHGYATAFSRPTLWIVCGLPASGKSTVAKSLSDLYGIQVIRSDVIRKALFAPGNGTPTASVFAAGLYTAYATETTYNKIIDLAGETLKKGLSVIIDATFSRGIHRREALRLAEQRQARPIFVECHAGDARLAERLRRRETKPSISDARLIHLARFKQRYAPMIVNAPAIHIPVNTEQPISDCLQNILLSEAFWSGAAGNP